MYLKAWQAFFRLGQAHAGNGDYEEALEAFKKAAEKAPKEKSIQLEIEHVTQKLKEQNQTHKFKGMFTKNKQPQQEEKLPKQLPTETKLPPKLEEHVSILSHEEVLHIIFFGNNQIDRCCKRSYSLWASTSIRRVGPTWNFRPE